MQTRMTTDYPRKLEKFATLPISAFEIFSSDGSSVMIDDMVIDQTAKGFVDHRNSAQADMLRAIFPN
jgi:hypothetical protein